MHKFQLTALVSLLSINIFGMESSKLATENTRLLKEVVIEKFNTQLNIKSDQNLLKLGIKTDSDLIIILPTEVWLNIIQCLDPKEKAILYFFAPRIGVTEEQAKVIAVNISNFAALNCKSIDEWENIINNACKSWGNLKNYKDNNEFAEKSKTKIREYLKILNSNFFKTLDIYKKALTSNNKKEEFEKMWHSLEEESGKFEVDCKKSYLEIRKFLLLGKHSVTFKKKLAIYFACALAPLIFLALKPLIDLTSTEDESNDYLLLIKIATPLMYLLEVITIIVSHKKSKYLCSFEQSLKNYLCRKHNNENIKIPEIIIMGSSILEISIKNYNKTKEYESEMLEFLNEQLGTKHETKDLDQILIDALEDTKSSEENLKEEAQLVAQT